MNERPISSGEIPSDGAVSLLRAIEENRTTGLLCFEHQGVRGDVALEAGQLAENQQPMADGRDPVEVLLSLRQGRYEIYQRLPPLPVTRGDAQCREGSLAIHVPADLMNYCERIGLTGVLTLWEENRCAEIAYDRGELTAIRLDGQDDEDLRDVFGWEEGSFRIDARPSVPQVEGARQSDGAAEGEAVVEQRSSAEGEGQLLRVMEVALTQIVSDRESFRPGSKSESTDQRSAAESSTRQAPAETPEPKPTAAAASTEAPEEEPTPSARPKRRRRHPTVRVVYLGGGATAPAGSASTQTADPRDQAASAAARPTSRASTATGDGTRKTGRQPVSSSAQRSGGTVSAAVAGHAHTSRASGGLDEDRSNRVRDPANMSSESQDDEQDGKPQHTEAQAHEGMTQDVADWREALVTVGWTAVTLAVMLAAIALLARLPELG